VPLCQVARRRCRCAPATLHAAFSHAHRTDHAHALTPRTHLQRVVRAIMMAMRQARPGARLAGRVHGERGKLHRRRRGHRAEAAVAHEVPRAQRAVQRRADQRRGARQERDARHGRAVLRQRHVARAARRRPQLDLPRARAASHACAKRWDGRRRAFAGASMPGGCLDTFRR